MEGLNLAACTCIRTVISKLLSRDAIYKRVDHTEIKILVFTYSNTFSKLLQKYFTYNFKTTAKFTTGKYYSGIQPHFLKLLSENKHLAITATFQAEPTE
jgi:hypothetical protein